jgi:hemerythrin
MIDVKDEEDRRRIKDVLDNIIDYTQSHFTFEESLQDINTRIIF